ncbi:hypothetical protein YA0089_26360 [Pseudomonas viridiflava]|uniref:hypothetical protein n=1 Tax=Pseudomonas viridiflava TaxID=33069 RepID=UPI0018E6258E|nr:hypothetical protein [Pseudomonas viridiflava]MBI6727140.1 hypothetical protein [Pseudomonas viridiflava]
MSTAFGISVDDIKTVASERLGVELSDERAEDLFDDINGRAVELAALHGDEMDEQTEYAHVEIKEQLIDLGVVSQLPAL